MSRKGIPLLLLVSLFCFIAASCADNAADRTAENVGPSADELERLEEELARSSEAQELVAIHEELAARAIANEVTPDQLRETAGDAGAANALLGLTPAEAKARFDRIEGLVGALYGRYPALAEMAARSELRYPVCDAESIALAWEHYSRVLPGAFGGGGALSPAAPARPPLKCKMSQLIIGFALCAFKSGGSAAFYLACGYGVFCGSCDGGIADIICP